MWKGDTHFFRNRGLEITKTVFSHLLGHECQNLQFYSKGVSELSEKLIINSLKIIKYHTVVIGGDGAKECKIRDC